MIIYQLLSDLTSGDAIGNDALAIDSLLVSMGYTTRILAIKIAPFLANRADLFTVEKIDKHDIVIYHESIGGKLSRVFERLVCKKILRYHNITPGIFFKPYRPFLAFRLEQGRKQLRRLAFCSDYSIPDSAYNGKELIEAGFNPDHISVLPVLVNFADYAHSCDEKLFAELKATKGTRILFTGRISPNKKIEDIIKVFYYYKTFVDNNAQLFLTGSTRTSEKYYAKLMGFVADLQLGGIHFTGHIPFNSLLSYYRSADVFVCMSEHEGFCVPLLEAMYFNVPIVAYASSAIPETLGGVGVLLNEKDFIAASEVIRKLIENVEYRNRIIMEQKKRLTVFTNDDGILFYKNTLEHILKTI